MSTTEKAAKWDALMKFTGGKAEEFDAAMVRVAEHVELQAELLRRGADALDKAKTLLSTRDAQIAELQGKLGVAEGVALELARIVGCLEPDEDGKPACTATPGSSPCVPCAARSAADAAQTPARGEGGGARRALRLLDWLTDFDGGGWLLMLAVAIVMLWLVN